MVLAIIAGDTAMTENAARALGRNTASIRLRHFYVEQLMLCPGANSYRILGAAPGAAKGRSRTQHGVAAAPASAPISNTIASMPVFAKKVTLALGRSRSPMNAAFPISFPPTC